MPRFLTTDSSFRWTATAVEISRLLRSLMTLRFESLPHGAKAVITKHCKQAELGDYLRNLVVAHVWPGAGADRADVTILGVGTRYGEYCPVSGCLPVTLSLKQLQAAVCEIRLSAPEDPAVIRLPAMPRLGSRYGTVVDSTAGNWRLRAPSSVAPWSAPPAMVCSLVQPPLVVPPVRRVSQYPTLPRLSDYVPTGVRVLATDPLRDLAILVGMRDSGPAVELAGPGVSVVWRSVPRAAPPVPSSVLLSALEAARTSQWLGNFYAVGERMFWVGPVVSSGFTDVQLSELRNPPDSSPLASPFSRFEIRTAMSCAEASRVVVFVEFGSWRADQLTKDQTMEIAAAVGVFPRPRPEDAPQSAQSVAAAAWGGLVVGLRALLTGQADDPVWDTVRLCPAVRSAAVVTPPETPPARRRVVPIK